MSEFSGPMVHTNIIPFCSWRNLTVLGQEHAIMELGDGSGMGALRALCKGT